MNRPPTQSARIAAPGAPPSAEQARYRVLLLSIVLLAFLLRVWGFSRLGLAHYDEGVYTLSGFWSLGGTQQGLLYPWQKFFSPPGYFLLVGVVFRLLGRASDLAAIAINIFFGTATVWLTAWMGRRWFGAAAGLFSAGLVALSQFQIAFSRTALTDTSFGFFFLLALALAAMAIETGRPWHAAFAGLAIGAAWNIKYHGWLLIPLATAAMAFEAIRLRGETAKLRRLLLGWIVLVLTAAACFLPWVVYCNRSLGGYLTIEKFHTRYLDFHWLHNLVQQAGMQLFFAGWLSRLAPAAGFLVVLAFLPKLRIARFAVIPAVFLILLALGASTGELGACLALALLGARNLWNSDQPFGRLLLIALAAFFILIPCYTPYARLVLPFSLLAAVAAGPGIAAGLSFLNPQNQGGQAVDRSATKARALLALGSLAAAAALWTIRPAEPWLWPPRGGGREAVSKMAGLVPKSSVIFVDTAPEVAFYFQQAGFTTFCTNSLAYMGEQPNPFTYQTAAPVFIVAGYYGRQQGDWEPTLRQAAARFQLVSRAAFEPSGIRLLDDFPAREAAANRPQLEGQYDLYLYRFLPEAQPVANPGTRP